MKNRLWAAALAMALVTAAAAAPRAEIIEQIIVKVNGDIITKTEFEQRQVLALRARKVDADPKSEELKKAVAEITPQLIVDAVDELILLQRGRDELGYKLSDEQFNQVVSQIRKDNQLETEEAFLAALKQEGMTHGRPAPIAREADDHLARAGPGRDAESGHHRGRGPGVSRRASRRVHEAGLRHPARNSAERPFVGGKASAPPTTRPPGSASRRFSARVKAGEAFEKIAGELSDAPSKANGGLIGPLTMTELAPGLQKLLSSMKPGDISEPLRTPKGYQLLKLETMTPEEVLPPEQVRDQIAEKLYAAKREVELRKYLARMRKEAIIEWKNDELRKAYEAGLAADATATPAPGPAPAPSCRLRVAPSGD